MNRRHEMPFGAQFGEDGTRFRLWAPACAAVALELGRESPEVVPMQALEGGWHEARVPNVQRGAA